MGMKPVMIIVTEDVEDPRVLYEVCEVDALDALYLTKGTLSSRFRFHSPLDI
jgi:hypothetical protein